MKKHAQAIQHAFEKTLDTSARLAAFARCTPTLSPDGLIDDRQRLQATDDLVFFAISARRWMELTDSLDRFSNLMLTVVMDKEQCTRPITRIMNLIIHHRDFRIARFSYETLKNPSYDDFLKENVKTFPPIVQVKAKEGKMLTFGLLDFITKFENDVMNPLVDECADYEIYLNEELYS